MAVWLPRVAATRPTIASTSRPTASHTWEVDTPTALNDQLEPASSDDDSVPRFTWWSHLGSTEWVEYDFDRAAPVQSIEVFWFDDRRIGGRCRVPASWRVLYRDGNDWKPVEGVKQSEIAIDRFNTIRFNPVTTSGLRLEVQLQPSMSSGVLEWKVGGARKSPRRVRLALRATLLSVSIRLPTKRLLTCRFACLIFA